MADNIKPKTINRRAKESEPTKTPTVSEQAITGSIKNVVESISEGLAVGLSAMIVGDSQNKDIKQLAQNISSSANNNIFNYIGNISESTKSFVESIKHMSKKIDSISSSLVSENSITMYGLLSEILSKMYSIYSIYTVKSNFEKTPLSNALSVFNDKFNEILQLLDGRLVNGGTNIKEKDYSSQLDVIINAMLNNNASNNLEENTEYLNYFPVLDNILNKLDSLQSNNLESKLNIEYIIDAANTTNLEQLLASLSKLDQSIPNTISELTIGLSNLSSIDFVKLNETLEKLNNVVNIVVDGDTLHESFNNLNKIINDVKLIVDSINSISDIDKEKITNLKQLKDFVAAFNLLANVYDAKIHTSIKNDLELLLDILPNKNGNSVLNDIFNAANKLPELTNEGRNNIDSLKIFFEAFNTIVSTGNFSTKDLIKNFNLLPELFEDINDIFKEIVKYDFKNDAAHIVQQLNYIGEVLTKKIEVTSVAVENQQKNLERINSGVNKAKETAIRGSEINQDEIDASNEASYKIMDSIALLGLVMILGGLIISRNEKIIVASLKFGITLSLFLLSLTPAIKLLITMSKSINSNENVNALDNIGDFIATSSLIMIAGSLIFLIGNGKMLKASLLFGLAFTLFLRSLILPLAFISFIVSKNNFENANKLGSLVASLAAIMIVGGLVMSIASGRYAKEALKFGVVLGIFIGLVLLPFAIYSRMFKNAIQGAEDINKLIVASTLLMLIGGAIMVAGGGRYWKQALEFGGVLGVFIASIIWPVVIYGLLVKKEGAESIKHLTLFIITATSLLVIGALIGTNNRIILGALKFSAVLFTFISLSILPFVFFNSSIRRLKSVLGDVILFISVSTIILMIGASIVANRPDIIIGALEFTAIMSLFIIGITTPFLLTSRILRRAWPGILALSLFIVTATAVMIAGANVINQYGLIQLLEFPLAMIAFSLAIGVGLKIISKFSKDVIIASASIVTLSIAIALMSLTFVLIKNTVNEISLKDILNFVLITSVIVGVIALISAVSSFLVIGEAAALGIGVVILSIAASLLLLHFVLNKIDLQKDFESLKAAIISAVDVFKTIGKGLGWIALGFVGSMIMSASLIALSIGFGIAHLLTSQYNAAEEFAVLGVAIESAGETFKKLGGIMLWVIPGMISSIMISMALVSLSIGFTILHTLVSDFDAKGDVDTINTAIDSLIILFKNIDRELGLGRTTKILGISLMLGFTLFNLAVTFSFIKIIGKLNINREIDDIIDNVDNISNLIFNINDSIIVKDVLLARLKTKEIKKMSKDLRSTFKSIKDLAEFANDVGNSFNPEVIADMILIFSRKEILKAIKKTVDNKKEYKKFDKTIKGTVGLLGDLSKNIYSIAKLEIPVYDENGKQIGKRTLNNGDFTLAAINAYNIITTLGRAISQVYDDNRELFDSSISSGLVGAITGKKTKFDKVVSGTSNLGKAISNIATAVSSISKLAIPLEYDSKGNPIKFRNMTRDDFSIAGENIRLIMDTFSKAILNVYNDNNELFNSEVSSGLIGKITGNKNKFDSVVSGVLNLGKAVSSIGEAVKSVASLSMPVEYDEHGKPTKFVPITNDTFNTAADNIKKIILTFASAIGDVYTNNSELFNSEVSSGIFRRIFKGSKNKFDIALAATMNIGNVVSSLATGLISIAELRFPVYDENGNIKTYETISNDSMKKVSNNVALILTTIGSGIQEAYSKFDKGDKIDIIIDTFSKIGNVISNVGSGLKDIASMNLPIYDNNGNIVDYKILKEEDFVSLNNNISRIITSTSEALKTAYDKLDMRPEKIEKIMDAFMPISTLLNSIIDTIVKYSNNTIDKDGKNINLSSSVAQMNSNFDLLIGGVFNKLKEIFDDNKNGLLKKSSKDLNNLIKNVDSLVKIFDSFTNIISTLSKIDETALNNSINIISQIIGTGNYKDNGLFSAILSFSDANSKISGATKTFNKINKLSKELDSIFNFTNELLKHSDEINTILNLSTNQNNNSELVGIFGDIDLIISNIVTILSKKINATGKDLAKLVTGTIALKDALLQIVEIKPSLIELKELYDLGIFNDSENIVERIIDFINSSLSSIKNIEKIKTEDSDSILNTLNNLNEYIDRLNVISMSASLLKTTVEANLDSLDYVNTFVESIDTTINTIKEKLLGENAVSQNALENMFIKVEKYKQILSTLSELSFIEFYKEAEEQKDLFNDTNRLTSLDIITQSIKNLNNEINENTSDKSLVSLEREVNSLDKFVKVVNQIDITRANKLTSLMSAMANLADKIGGFDKLIDALNGEFSKVIDDLSRKVDDANKTINDAKEFEIEKKKDLSKNVAKIEELMNKSLTINVGRLNDDGSITAQYESEKNK